MALTNLLAEEPSAPLEFVLIHEQPFEGSERLVVKELGIDGHARKEPDLSVTRLKDVRVHEVKYRSFLNNDGSGQESVQEAVWHVMVVLDDSEASAFSALTGKAIGKRLMIKVRATPVIAPIIQGELGASFQITGPDHKEAEALADQLRPLVNDTD